MPYGSCSSATMTASVPPLMATHGPSSSNGGSCRRSAAAAAETSSSFPTHDKTKPPHRPSPSLGDAAASSSIVVQPPTPQSVAGPQATMKSPSPVRFAPDAAPAPPSSSSTYSSRSNSPAGSPSGSAHASPRRPHARFPSSTSPSSSFYTAGTGAAASGSGGQDVRPPRRKRVSPGASPVLSPAQSRRSSQEDVNASRSPQPTPAATLEPARVPRLETTSPSPVRSPNTPPVSSPLLPLPAQSASSPTSPGSPASPSDGTAATAAAAGGLLAHKPSKHQLRRPGGNSFNSRREASGRPTLASTTAASVNSAGGGSVAESEAISALRLNLDILGRPKYDHASKTFVTEARPAPYTLGGAKSPMIRKKSGELVRPALKMTLTPSYEPNPLSAASNASASSASSSPFVGSRSLPATPSFPKIVHFDTQLERVRLFRSEQRPTAVSRGGSPDENDEGRNSDGYPFPSTSDEEEIARRSLEIKLPNFPTQVPFDADVYLQSVALTEDSRHLRGVVHVRNLTFAKRVVIRFTFDHWSTTSETTATFHESIKGGTFDRFVFLIKLQDLMARIEEKTLFMCVRYTPEGRDDLWDSNGGQNFKVEFKKRRGMRAADLRDRKGSRRGTEWTDRSAANGGAASDRMADLKAHLGRLALDDPDDDDVPRSPGYRSSPAIVKAAMSAAADRNSTASALLSPRSGSVPALSARYSFGSASIKVSPAREGRSASVGTGWNGSPAGGNHNVDLPGTPVSPLPGSPGFSASGPTIGLRFDGVPKPSSLPTGASMSHERPSFGADGLPSSAMSSFNDWKGLGEKSPRDSETLAYSTRVVPTQPDQQQPLKTFEPMFSPGFNEGSFPDAFANAYSSPIGSAPARFEYFSSSSASSPPFSAGTGSPSAPAPDFGASSSAPAAGRSTYSSHSAAVPASSGVSFTSFSMDGVPSSPSSDSMRSLSSQSSDSSGTPALTASSTPAESPMSPPVGRIFPAGVPDFSTPSAGAGLRSASYSEFVNQYCFYTGPDSTSEASRSSMQSQSSLGDLYGGLEHGVGVSSSGYSTPTNRPVAAVGASPYVGGVKSPFHSDSELDHLKDSEGQKTPQQVNTPTGSFDSSPLNWATTTPRTLRS